METKTKVIGVKKEFDALANLALKILSVGNLLKLNSALNTNVTERIISGAEMKKLYSKSDPQGHSLNGRTLW